MYSVKLTFITVSTAILYMYVCMYVCIPCYDCEIWSLKNNSARSFKVALLTAVGAKILIIGYCFIAKRCVFFYVDQRPILLYEKLNGHNNNLVLLLFYYFTSSLFIVIWTVDK